MNTRRWKIGLAVAGTFTVLTLALGLVARQAWEDRRGLVARLAAELGGVELSVEEVGFELGGARRGLVAVRLDGVKVAGTRVEHAGAGIDLLASLNARQVVLHGIVVSGIALDPAKFASSAADNSASKGSAHDLASLKQTLLHFGSLRLENATIATEGLGIKGPLHISAAELNGDPANDRLSFTLQATLAESQPLTAAGELGIDDSGVRLGSLVVDANKLKIAPFYYRFVDPNDALPAAPLDIEHLAVRGEIVIGKEVVLVDLKNVELRSAMADASATVYVKDAPNAFEYRVGVEIAQGTQAVLPALPPSLIGKTVHEWLARNLAATAIESATLRLNGTGDGLKALDLKLPISRTQLTFAPEWPAVDNISGLVQITETGLAVEGHGGSIASMPIESFSVVVPDFAKEPTLVVDARVAGDTEATLTTLAATPLASVIKKIRALPLRLAGKLGANLRVRAKLDAPADDPNMIGVAGDADLNGVSAQLTDTQQVTLPPLSDLRGKVHFTMRRINSIGKLAGRFDGSPALIAFDLPLDRRRTVAKIAIEARSRVKSVFEALGVDAPSTADGSVRAKLDGELAAADGGGVAYKGKGDINLTEATFSLGDLYAKKLGALANLRVQLAGTSGERHDLDLSYISGKDTAHAKLAMTTTLNGTVDLSLTNAHGSIVLPSTSTDPVVASFSRLHIPAVSDDSRTRLTSPTSTPRAEIAAAKNAIDPRRFPAVRLTCEDLVVGARKLGRVELRTRKVANGQHVDYLAVDLGSASIYGAKGHWLVTPTGTDATLEGDIELDDGGQALAALGLDRDVEGLYGYIGFKVLWPNIGPDFDTHRLTAKLAVDVQTGRLAGVNGVALKALDVLSLRFLDLTKEGLEIESADGELTYTDGKLQIARSKIETPTARIEAKGDLDVAAERVAAKAAVTLKISRTVNAVALGLVNPLLAVGYLSRDSNFTVVKLDRFTRHSYEISGPWADPKVTLAATH